MAGHPASSRGIAVSQEIAEDIRLQRQIGFG